MTFTEYLNQEEPQHLPTGSVMIERADMGHLSNIPLFGYVIGLHFNKGQYHTYHVETANGESVLRTYNESRSVFALSPSFLAAERQRVSNLKDKVGNAKSLLELMEMRQAANWQIWVDIDAELAIREKQSHSEPIRLM